MQEIFRGIRFGAGFLFIAGLVFLWPAAPAVAGQTQDSILNQARRHLAVDAGPADLQQAASLLEAGCRRFPEAPDFPLLLAEALYRQADPEADLKDTFPLYEKAGKHAKEALRLDPDRPEAHYWYGLSELKKAQKTGGVRAYFQARSGIRELETVRRELPAYDRGGASRVLGLLYGVAPGWSPFGDLEKAIAYGAEAVALAPDYHLNHLYLARARYKAGDHAGAARSYRKILELPTAKGTEDFVREAREKLAEIARL